LADVKSLPEESHVHENVQPKSIYFDCRCLELPDFQIPSPPLLR